MDRTYTLAIDTSAGIALGLAEKDRIVASFSDHLSNAHVERLQPMIDQMMSEYGISHEQIERIVVGIGPGPFTGLRIGIVTAKTLSYIWKVPLIAVSSLDALALSCRGIAQGDEFIVATDARRREVYWARYRHGRRCEGPEVDSPNRLSGLIYGPAVEVYQELAPGDLSGERVMWIDGGILAAHVDELEAVDPEPCYLRQPDAVVATTRKSALGQRRLPLPPVMHKAH